jgi:predicted N-acyltransferase
MSMRTTQCWTRFDSVDAVPADDLRALGAPRCLYESVQWLRYCELSAPGAMRYVGVHDAAGRLRGLTALRLVADGRLMSLYDLGALLRTGGAPADGLPDRVYPNLVAAVSGAHCVLLTRADAPADEKAATEVALAGAAAEEADRAGCETVAFLYLDDLSVAERVGQGLGPGAGRPFVVAAQTHLAGGWPDFDGYLRTLRSARRNKIRRERRDFEAGGFRTRVVSGVAELGAATARLQLALRRKYAVTGSIEAILRDYEHLDRTVGGSVVVFLSECDGELVGMSMCLRDRDVLHVRLAGFDYTRTGAEFVYFNTVYYEPIRWGITEGIRSYVFGTGTYQPKLARGCVPRPRYGVARWPSALRPVWARAVDRYDAQIRMEAGLAVGAQTGHDR